jgi:macrolide-specific efflux system membrane fusion protein
VEANQKVPGSVPKTEIRKLLLTWQRSVLEIEQAQMNMRIAALEAAVSQAEVEASQENLKRRKIISPLDAVVVEMYRNQGEWVQPGDPVMRIVRMNRLRIKGHLNAGKVAPAQADGQPVTVGVELAGGRREQFVGKVVFVDPIVESVTGEYQVWAEVDNRQDPSGHWVLRPGLEAKMAIQLK